MDDRKLDQLLKDRYMPEAPSNLASRIIDASKNMPQDHDKSWSLGLGGVLEGFTQLFKIPQPAFVFASVALLSVCALGLSVYNTELMNVEPTPEYYQEAEEVELAFYLDDIFEVDY